MNCERNRKIIIIRLQCQEFKKETGNKIRRELNGSASQYSRHKRQPMVGSRTITYPGEPAIIPEVLSLRQPRVQAKN